MECIHDHPVSMCFPMWLCSSSHHEVDSILTLESGWPYGILWPIERGRCGTVLILHFVLKRLGTFPFSKDPAVAIRTILGKVLEDEWPCGVGQNLPSGGVYRPANLLVAYSESSKIRKPAQEAHTTINANCFDLVNFREVCYVVTANWYVSKDRGGTLPVSSAALSPMPRTMTYTGA